MIEMEGSGLTGEDLKEKFARLGRRVCLLCSLTSLISAAGRSADQYRKAQRLDHSRQRVMRRVHRQQRPGYRTRHCTTL